MSKQINKQTISSELSTLGDRSRQTGSLCSGVRTERVARPLLSLQSSADWGQPQHRVSSEEPMEGRSSLKLATQSLIFQLNMGGGGGGGGDKIS